MKSTYYFIFTLIIISALSVRILFGVELTDEAQYITQALQPLIKSHFFGSDLFIQQFVYVLFFPLTKLYHSVYGSEAIFLFCRVLYVLITLLSCSLLYFHLKRFYCNHVAYLCSLSMCSFIPFSIPSISYNTILYVFTPPLLLLLLNVDKLKKYEHISLVLILFLVTLSYPPILITILFFSLYNLYKKNFKSFPHLAISGIASLLILLFFKENLADTLSFSSNFTKSTPKEKISLIFNQGSFLFFVVLQSILLVRFKRQAGYLFLPITVILFVLNLLLFSQTEHYGHDIILVLACLLIPGALLITKSKNTDIFLILSLFCSFTLAYSSSNGLPNASMSLLIPSILASSFLFTSTTFLTVNSVIIISLMYSNYTFFYRESPIVKLNTTVQIGPYKGLRTTKARKKELDFTNSTIRLLNKKANDSLSTLSIGYPSLYSYNGIIPHTKMLYIHPGELPKKVLDIIANCDYYTTLPKILLVHSSISRDTINAYDKCLDIRRNYSEFRKTKKLKFFIQKKMVLPNG